MRISWVHPEVFAGVAASLRAGGEVAPPADVEVTPRLAAHVSRAEAVRGVVAREGVAAAAEKFGASEHAIERAAVLEALGDDAGSLEELIGLLACPLDEYLAYGHFLSRLVEVGAAVEPATTVAAFERFVAAAGRVDSEEPSWPERLRVARDGLAALYVRVGRADDAEALYRERFDEEPSDTTVAIGAARAFLEAGDTARSLVWLDRAAQRAEALGRDGLAARLRTKTETLKTRRN